MQPLFDDIGSMTNPTHVVLGYSENIVHELLTVKNALGTVHEFTQGEMLALDVATGQYYPITLTIVASTAKEKLADATGESQTVSVTLDNMADGNSVIPGSVTVYGTISTVAKTGTDDGYGNIEGDITGTINYQTGAVALTAAAFDSDTDIEATYAVSESPRAIVKEGEEVEVANGETETVNGYVGGLFDLTQLFVGSTDNMYGDLDDEVKSFYRDELMKYNIRITDVLLSEPE